MNKARRKQLSEILDKLNEIKEDLEVVLGEEEEYRDNMPENLQSSEKYEKTDSACTEIDSAVNLVDEAIACADYCGVVHYGGVSAFAGG
jgi:flagellar biosynthesis chaperone FliJ